MPHIVRCLKLLGFSDFNGFTDNKERYSKFRSSQLVTDNQSTAKRKKDETHPRSSRYREHIDCVDTLTDEQSPNYV